VETRLDWLELGKVSAVAIAVGLDVFAVSVGVGITRLLPRARVRVGLAFALAEIGMQLLGYEIGNGAGKLLGDLAAYAGFALLALIGLLILRKAILAVPEPRVDHTAGLGLLMTALSISLDSLAVGAALPGAGIPLLPLLVLLSITTTVFTWAGLEFGARLGERYERRAEGFAGVMLIVLALGFASERLL
jgi:putative Mn2+ efflux pump MntP